MKNKQKKAIFLNDRNGLWVRFPRTTQRGAKMYILIAKTSFA